MIEESKQETEEEAPIEEELPIASEEKVVEPKDTLEELKQRFEDIEDLIMVEQAGIMELKKMMEAKKEAVVPSVTPELEERLKKIESAAAISTKPETEKLEIKIKELENRIEILERNVKGKLEDFEEIVRKPSPLDAQIDELIDKIVFLESRLRAMEKIMEKPVKGQ